MSIGDLVRVRELVEGTTDKTVIQRLGQIGEITNINLETEFSYKVEFCSLDQSGSNYNVFTQQELELVYEF